jgi:Helicase associated domain/Transcription factor WhiB
MTVALAGQPRIDWIAQAVCGDADPALFDGDVQPAGAAYCARCPVRGDCVADAITNNADGAWGGLSQTQREALAEKGWTVGQPLPPVETVTVPHGTPLGYDRGCDCAACVKAYRPYQQAARTSAPRRRGVLVSAARARTRLGWLARRGLTVNEVTWLSGVPTRRLQQVLEGTVEYIPAADDAALAGLVLPAVAAGRPSRRRRTVADDTWQQRYQLLRRWAGEQGHARPGETVVVDGVRLGRWVVEQRAEWARGRLPAGRAAKLEALPGWAWQIVEHAWEAAFTRVEAYVAEHGHARVPQQHRAADGFYLGAWVYRQRSERAAGRLRPARAARLEALPGWTWDSRHHADFEAGIAALTRFADEHGHACPTARCVAPDGFKLGRWVANHRHRRAELDLEQVSRLEALPGWDWDPFETRWQVAYQALARFAARTGHTFVPRGHLEPGVDGGPDQAIDRWIAQQRTDRHGGRLAKHRRRLLEALPAWTWDGYEARRGVARTGMRSTRSPADRQDAPDAPADGRKEAAAA